MNHIWFRDKSGVPYGFVRGEAGEVKTVYVSNDEFDQYLMKPSTEANKWVKGEWVDIPRLEALQIYEKGKVGP